MDLFDKALSVAKEDLEFELRGQSSVQWADFFLNPRRLRGSDFLMRWSQGAWSEHIIIQAVNEATQFYALPYGPSSIAPDNDVRAYELYFERLEKAGLGQIKRPDLLLFHKSDQNIIEKTIREVGGIEELPFTPEDDKNLKILLSRAILAVECENSLWLARKMPDYGSELKPMARLGGKPGLRKNAVLPTVIIKEEDRAPLLKWQEQQRIAIHVWQVFHDIAFGIGLNKIEDLIRDGVVEGNIQVFQAPGGATTKKILYKVYYHYAYPLGKSQMEPTLVADCITDKNGHILPYVRFEGGSFIISPEALQVLKEARNRDEK